jgi:hypothetical protein
VNVEDIKLALRLVAMGRVNHALVDELADELAKLCAPEPVAEAEPKRGPGRPRKSE